MQLYTPVIIKLTLGFLSIIFQINILGKSNLAPSSAMDQVQNYVLAGIIGGVIYNDNISITQFILVLIIWTVLVLTVKFAKEHNHTIKHLINGKPITLIQNGILNVPECLKNGISANELMFQLRSDGIYEISQVKRAILEQNGQLTIILFGDENVRYPIIVDGLENFDVLDLIQKDEQWLLEQVQAQGFHSISDIYLGEYVTGELILYRYPET